MFNVRSRGQSTLEYVILIGFVVAALIAMGVYMKRGAEGRLRESTDGIGEQYDALNTTSKYVTTYNSRQTESTANSGVTTTTVEYSIQNRIGNETVHEWDVETE